ncbi:CPBP family glutamic-type intramembrane protease [Neobacillus drentensis]|uniref:CPBP family intramembrane glutamic endopeptidase n=1 Tax=Neobacillus drentensis TaxID=220684 RepID=UPI002FFD6A3E
MTTNLTEPISKKLLFAMLVVTIGAEVLLYLTRYSTLASTLYDAVMVSSLFIGWKLHRRIKCQQGQGYPKGPRQLTLQFTGAFLIFFFGSTLINVYSNITFQDFSEDYDQFVQDYTDNQTYDAGDDGASQTEPISSFFEKVDTIGYDLYTDSLAGLEEVWRLAYIILLLVIFKKMFPRRWESGSRDRFLIAALFITSILFGIDHTLDTEQPWAIRMGAIVTFANMGFLFGIILLWTRNLWITVMVHALYDITATLSWYYIDYAVEYFTLGVLIVHLCLYTLDKMNQKRLMRITQEVQRVEMTQNIE